MEYLPTIIAGLLTLLAGGITLAWLRCHSNDLRVASEFLDRHYHVTQKLIADPEVPSSVVEFAVGMAAHVGQPGLARSLALDVVTGRLTAEPTASTERGRRFRADLIGLKEPQRKLFSEMMVFGLFSSAASDPLLSRVYLKCLTLFFSKSGVANDHSISPERANTAALDLSERELCLA